MSQNQTGSQVNRTTLQPAAGRGPVRRVQRSHDPQEVLAFIVKYKREHDGNSPSLRDIMKACDISSNAVAFAILQKLDKQGRILLDKSCGRSRSIMIPGGKWILEPARTV